MPAHVFDSDDREYQDWLLKHPTGFVANTTRTQTSSYLVLHRSSCRTISQYSGRVRLGGYTERGYIKVVADSVPALVAWGRANRDIRLHGPSACSLCLAHGSGAHTVRARPTFSDEVDPARVGIEGAVKQISVNRYERDPAARAACIKHFGTRCTICGFDFEAVYGKLGRGYIQVHHLIPLSTRRRRYKVDPKKHLCPVCPNCHAMLHADDPALSPAELKKRMKPSRFSK